MGYRLLGFIVVGGLVVKGKRRAVTIYELLESNEENRKMTLSFKRALELYMRGDFEEALYGPSLAP